MFKYSSTSPVPASTPWWVDPIDVGMTTADEGYRINQGIQAGRAANSAKTGIQAGLGIAGKTTASKLPVLGAGLSYFMGRDQMKGIGNRIDSFKGTNQSYLGSAEGVSDVMSGLETYAPMAGMAVGAGVGSLLGPGGTLVGGVAGGAIGGLVGSVGTAGKALQKGFTGFDAAKNNAAYGLASGKGYTSTANYTQDLIGNYKNSQNLKSNSWFGGTRDATVEQGKKVIQRIKPGGADRMAQPQGQVS